MEGSKVTGTIICEELVEKGGNNRYSKVYVLKNLELYDGSRIDELISGPDVKRSSKIGNHTAYPDEAGWSEKVLEANAEALRTAAEAEGLDWLLELLPTEER